MLLCKNKTIKRGFIKYACVCIFKYVRTEAHSEKIFWELRIKKFDSFRCYHVAIFICYFLLKERLQQLVDFP